MKLNILFLVVVLCNYNSKLFSDYLTIVKFVLQYFKAIRDCKLDNNIDNHDVTIYIDFNYKNNNTNQK